MSIIRDAQGGAGLKVNDEGQALTQAEARTEARHVSAEGDCYLLASGFAVSATSADDFTNIFYLKNDYTELNIHIGYLRTCNEVAGKWQLREQPTALGTTALTPTNMNTGSSKTLSATVQAFSAAGTTFTDGTVIGQWIQGGPAHSIQPYEGSLELSPGKSIGLEFAPFGTTAGDVCITIQVWSAAD